MQVEPMDLFDAMTPKAVDQPKFGEIRAENGGLLADHQNLEPNQLDLNNPGSDYSNSQGYLHLTDCVYTNPYELATFYDNHDMARMNASENGFIDAHNWLFTSRGIPVTYYGSEMRFMRGKAGHQGTRKYFGPGNIAAARNGEVFKRLARIADIRKQSVALQKGLQANTDHEWKCLKREEANPRAGVVW